MIAGATGFDSVVLCISALESVMPQTREHLSILNLLGVAQGIIAITMCDLADADDLELIELELEELVAGTFLEGAPIIHTAAGEQPQGIEELKEAIDQLPNATMTETGPFRLPIDRAFTQKGFGVVVTGTSRDGSVSVGDNLMVMPEGIATKARSIQAWRADKQCRTKSI